MTDRSRGGIGPCLLGAWLAAALVLLLVAPRAAAQGAPVLPDLVADPPGVGHPLEVYDNGSGDRLLLRFDGFVHNRGQGKLELRGSDPSGVVMGTVGQRLFRSDGSYVDSSSTPAPQLIYETNDDHAHWHLRHAARYSLWNLARTAEVAPSSKVGFCLVDSQAVDAHAGTPSYRGSDTNFCGWRDTAANNVFMGVSPGYRDIYGADLAFQWIDVSQVAPGRYWLRSDIDPDRVINESQETNSAGWAGAETVVPGHVAAPVNGGGATAGVPKGVTLSATTFGSPGPLQYKVVTAPRHGTLNRPTGQWFSGEVAYTPDSSYSGPDSFTFAARDSSSPFPLSPPTAAATLQVQPPPAAPGDQPPPVIAPGPGPVLPPPPGGSTPARTLVDISGAPARMYAGTSAQLTATVTGGRSRHVSWSVNDRPGGGKAGGRISSSGLYRAPGTVPPGRSVRIAAAADGAEDAVRIRIAPAPARPPSPSLGCPRALRSRVALSCLRVSHHGRRLLVKVLPGRPGTLKVRARYRGRTVGSCTVRASRRRAVACAMRLPRGAHAPGIRISAFLLVRRRVVAVRRGLVP
jgi:hypothetical protein